MENEHQIVSKNGYLITDNGFDKGYMNSAEAVGKHVVAVNKDIVEVCQSSEDLSEYGFINIHHDFWYSQEYLKANKQMAKMAEKENRKNDEKEFHPNDSRFDKYKKILLKLKEIEGYIEYVRDNEGLRLICSLAPAIADLKKVEGWVETLEIKVID